MRRTIDGGNYASVELTCGNLVYIKQIAPDGSEELIVMDKRAAIALADAIYAGCASALHGDQEG
ncbi:hypothetical protein TomTYG75_06670 [Sphingobium sp. TomTYG75]